MSRINKRQKPHYRTSKKGKKFKAGRGRKSNVLDKRKRTVFTSLTKHPFEVGGQADFEKGKLENVRMHFGGDSEIEFDWDPDYEVSWHSHPDVSIMPSYDDIISMKQTNEKEQIIFYKDIALSVAEDKKFLKVPNSRIKNVINQMDRDYSKGMSDKLTYKKYKPIFKKELGLDMKWHSPNKDIILKTRSV